MNLICNWRNQTPKIVHEIGIDYRLLSGQGMTPTETNNYCMKGGYYFAHAMLQPGKAYEAHSHSDHEEIYYVISGKGTIDLDGVVSPIRDGDAIYIEAGASHSIANTGDDFLVFVAMGIQV